MVPLPRHFTNCALLCLSCALLTSCDDSTGDAAPPASRASGSTNVAQTQAQQDWPIYRGNSALRGLASGPLEETLELLWTFETGGAIASSPIVVNDRVYVGSDDGFVYCVNLSDGSEIWKFKTDDIIEAPPLFFDGVIYIGASDFFLYALNAATGELIWKSETDDTILGGANVVEIDGMPPSIVVGSYDARLYCFDAKSGEQLWTYQTLDRVNGTPAVVGERVIFGGCDSILHLVNARDAGESVCRVELGDNCHIAGSVGIDDGDVFFGHYGNQFVSIDLDTLTVNWTYDESREPFFSAPAISESHVVFGGRDRLLHCVDRETGAKVWTYATQRKVDGSPVICDGKVVFGSGDGRLYMLDLKSGEELWTYDLGRSIFSSPAVVNGMIIVGCGDKRLYAFGGTP